jgi:hypothetical protein
MALFVLALGFCLLLDRYKGGVEVWKEDLLSGKEKLELSTIKKTSKLSG